MDVAEEFILLGSGSRPGGSAVVTRSVMRIEQGNVLVGMDSENHRLVLVPVNSIPEGIEDRRSRALALTARTLQLDNDAGSFIVLTCTDPALNLVFERVVADVVGRLEADAEPSTVCSDALADWRAMFQAASIGMDREAVIGLVGELEILSRLGLADKNAALEAWWGPSGHMHDFYNNRGAAIEVKSTASLEGNLVHISNLDQLDPGDVSSLHLAVCSLRPDLRAPTLDERIRLLIADGFARDTLIQRVADAGHVFEAATTIDTRYAVKSTRLWEVNEGFPGLRRSEFGEDQLRGVSNVKYELMLDSVGRPVDAGDVEFVFKNWVAE